MHRYLLILLISGSICTAAYGQDKEFIYTDSTLLAPEEAVADTDENMVEEIPDTTLIRSNPLIHPDTIAYLKAKKEFAYVSGLDSLLKLQQQQQQSDTRTAGRSAGFLERVFNSALLKIIFWLIAGAVVLFIITKLFTAKGFFRTSREAKEVEEKEDEEKVYSKSDYMDLIHQSCKLGDYRAAVKYHFLYTLQLLSEHSLIEYATDKTNYTYLQEISSDRKKDFSRLVLNYEYVWYGNLHIERAAYERIESEFTTFQQKISY